MTIVYRLLTIIINIFSAFVALMVLIMLPMAIASPALLLPVFMLVCIVLYSWYSNRFRQQVLIKQQMVKKSLKDWVKVNGYVSLVFSFLNISSSIAILRNPSLIMNSYNEMVKQFGTTMQRPVQTATITTASVIMLIWVVALAIHVLWTFALIKKNEAYFDPQ